ncbi:MAG: c-type cytochrome [Nitrospinaceae bacterium]
MFFRLIAVGIAILGFSGPYLSVWANGDDTAHSGNVTPRYLIKKGKSLFLKYCAPCHGVGGDGDGFNAKYLDKEPAELSDEDFISKKTNEQIFRIIKMGGAGVKKSHLMPVFGNTFSEAELWSLVAYVRNLASDDSHPVSLPRKVKTERPKGHRVTKEDVESFSKWLASEGQKQSIFKEGKRLFKKKKSCFACHQVDGEGGSVGPELSRAGYWYRPEWIYAWIRNPQAYKPTTVMPNMGLQPETAKVIAAYLWGLHEENEGVPEKWEPYLEAQGDPERGKKLFFDPEGKVNCSKCHRINGEGGNVGPDLSYVGSSRTRPFLLESMLKPKAVITAGYSTVLILTKHRKFITGIKVMEDDSGLDIIDKEGKEMYIHKEQIKKYKTQKISMMPGNFKDILDVQEVADILAYLKTLTLPEIS